jgi:hypothetical protein
MKNPPFNVQIKMALTLLFLPIWQNKLECLPVDTGKYSHPGLMFVPTRLKVMVYLKALLFEFQWILAPLLG